MGSLQRPYQRLVAMRFSGLEITADPFVLDALITAYTWEVSPKSGELT